MVARHIRGSPHRRRRFDQKFLYNSMDYTRFGRERVPAGNPEVILMDIGVSSETAKGEEAAHPRVCSEGSF
jgi:hypothetical protein